MKMMKDYSLGRATLLAGLCLGTAMITLAPKVSAQTSSFFVSIEPPGVANQVSPLVVNGVNYGAEGVHVEDFNRSGVAPGTGQTIVIRNGFDFGANSSGFGTYSSAVVRTADQFGGAAPPRREVHT
jgi:hypothetical protein